MEILVYTEGLTKEFHNHCAVNQVNLNIYKGDIYGFIGRNGAGKTTCMKMLGGLTFPTSGNICIFGKSGKELYHSNSMRDIGILIEQPGLYPNMTVVENLRMQCYIMKISNSAEHITQLLGLVRLAHAKNKKAKNLSLGMKQRLGIAIAMVGNPQLLILDEPLNGLDPEGIIQMRELLVKLQQERETTIMISSHILEELSKISTRYGFIEEGNMKMEVSRGDLEKHCEEQLILRTSQIDRACQILSKYPQIQYSCREEEIIITNKDIDSAALNQWLCKEDVPVQEIFYKKQSLEEFYMDCISGKVRV